MKSPAEGTRRIATSAAHLRGRQLAAVLFCLSSANELKLLSCANASPAARDAGDEAVL